MISWLGGAATRVTDLLLAEVLLSSVVAAVVLLACAALGGRRPALQQALWGLVLVRLILPPGLAHPLGAGTLLARAGLVTTSAVSGEPGDSTAGAPGGLPSDTRDDVNARSLVTAGFWLAGVVSLLFLDARRARAFGRALAGAEPVTDRLALRLARRWSRRLGIRRPVRLVTADRLLSPFTDGLLRPVVYLPAAVLRPGHRHALAAALSHELAHVARWDVLRLRAERLVARLYFFHPAAWLVSRRRHALRERMCDALATSPGLLSPRLYVRGLLELLQLDLQGVEAPSLTPPQRRTLMRLESVLSTTRRAHRPLPALVAAAGIGFFLLPLAAAPLATPATRGPQTPSARSRLADPLPSGRVTRRFGPSRNPFTQREEVHKGIDLAAPQGTPVLSAGPGTVELATKDYTPVPVAGTVVVVDHGGGRKTFYSHLSTLEVKAGQRVTRGQTLGKVGNTGVSTAPHLHFEVWEDGAQVDPAAATPALSER